MTVTPVVTSGGSINLKQAMLSLFIVFNLTMLAAVKFLPGRDAIDSLLITSCSYSAGAVLVGWVLGKAWEARP